jgi:hypothetical protein
MQEKLSLFKEFIKLASADQDVREQEYHFIVSVAKMLGVEHNTVDSLFAENIEVVIPKDEASRILQFYRMVLLMNVDHHVDNDELNFVRTAGIRLGLRPMAVEKVLEEMKKNERGMIPENKLIEIFSAFRN